MVYEMLFYSVIFLTQALSVFANTEKVIFIGPTPLQIPLEHPTLEDLRLDTLTPQHWSLRTHIQAQFPTNFSQYGQSSWYLLDKLRQGQRYEVRVCWAATEPTSFHLDTYSLPTVFETPELITSLAQYSELRQSIEKNEPERSIALAEKKSMTYEDISTILFLRILAAADYHTINTTLMQHVPAVYADIILDPFILNVFPRSLLPTAAYLLVIAIGSCGLSKHISVWFGNLHNAGDLQKKNA